MPCKDAQRQAARTDSEWQVVALEVFAFFFFKQVEMSSTLGSSAMGFEWIWNQFKINHFHNLKTHDRGRHGLFHV